MTNCPLCKSKVLFAGLFSLECSGRGCENFKGSAESEVTLSAIQSYILRVAREAGMDLNALDFAWGSREMTVRGLIPEGSALLPAGSLILFTVDDTWEEIKSWFSRWLPETRPYL